MLWIADGPKPSKGKYLILVEVEFLTYGKTINWERNRNETVN